MQKTVYPPIVTYVGENPSKFIKQLENAYNHQFWQQEGNNRQLYRSGESIIAIEKGKAPDDHLSIGPSDITLPVSERYFNALVKRLKQNTELFYTDYLTVHQDNKPKVELALEKNLTLTVIPKKQATPVTISNTETPLAPDHTVSVK
ncbi:hypothetical protein ACP6PM_17805 [Dapis sp. BLCC M229]